MGINVVALPVTIINIDLGGEYVPGTRLRVELSDGEVLFFREARRDHGPLLILDVERSSETVTHELYTNAVQRFESDGGQDGESGDAAPAVADILRVTKEADPLKSVYFYLEGTSRRGDELTIGEELFLWRTSAYASGGTGATVGGDRTVADVEVVHLEGAP